MSLDQIHNMEMVLEWVKACPFRTTCRLTKAER